jgi:hypothetical protein
VHFLTDEDNPAGIVATLLGALPTGSYLLASHVTPEHDPAGVSGLERAYRQGGVPAQARTAGLARRDRAQALLRIPPAARRMTSAKPGAGRG